jgi:hypothetical protein
MSNIKDVKSKGTPITLGDGVERKLRFTLNALAELEDRYGSVDDAFDALENGSIKAIRFVLWAGLLHSDEGLTEQQVGNLIDTECIKEIMQTLGTSLRSDMPDNGDNVPNA